MGYIKVAHEAEIVNVLGSPEGSNRALLCALVLVLSCPLVRIAVHMTRAARSS